MQEDRLFEQRLAVFVSDILNSNATKRFDKLASDLGQDVSAVRKRCVFVLEFRRSSFLRAYIINICYFSR